MIRTFLCKKKPPYRGRLSLLDSVKLLELRDTLFKGDLWLPTKKLSCLEDIGLRMARLDA